VFTQRSRSPEAASRNGYCPRLKMPHSIPTRSACEVMSWLPRWRFGLMSSATAASIAIFAPGNESLDVPRSRLTLQSLGDMLLDSFWTSMERDEHQAVSW